MSAPEIADSRSYAARMIGACEAVLWLLTAGILLKVFPFSRLFREVAPHADGPEVPRAALSVVARIRADVGAAAERMPWKPTCMPRALASQLMCRARGLSVPIAISVAINGSGLGAHASLIPGTDTKCATATPTGRRHLARILPVWF